ncbi:hypothetical protein [Lysinibacillus xylanilyticus]|uniref:hypothetical protein n=1 Tax=Lysinibacillus xylanilyticus TaxID=582475 RepID=UPI00382D546E
MRSEATATTGFVCANAKRQQQRGLSVRMRSGCNNGVCLRECEAAAITMFAVRNAKL